MRLTLCAVALLALSLPMQAADPTIKLGATIFADYVNTSDTSAFNVNRAYINVTGTLGERIAFRITPDIFRADGGQQFRLKYAYAQLNVLGNGSFLRLGMQQTPYLDATEAVYRYRFQGTGFAEREGYLSSSDNGVSLRYVLPKDFGDVHAGFYNGEGYAKGEANSEKAIQIRATVKPLKGLRTTLFAVNDHYDETAPRERLIGQLTYEHARFNAGVDLLSTKDRDLEGRGWSAWATPKLGNGWELLLRHDHNEPDQHSDVVRKRTITGVAYWVPNLSKATAAILFDRDSLSVTGKDDDTRYGVKMLLVF